VGEVFDYVECVQVISIDVLVILCALIPVYMKVVALIQPFGVQP